MESEIEISGIWGEIIGEIGKASTTISGAEQLGVASIQVMCAWLI